MLDHAATRRPRISAGLATNSRVSLNRENVAKVRCLRHYRNSSSRPVATLLPICAISLNLASGGRAFGLPRHMKRLKSIWYLRFARIAGVAIVLLAANAIVLSLRASAQDDNYLAT